MTMEIIQGFACMASHTERGASTVEGYYAKFEHAEVDSKRNSWYGGDGSVKPVKLILLEDGRVYPIPDNPFVLINSPEDKETYAKYSERAKLAKKLSDSELKSMGYTRDQFLNDIKK